MIAVAVDPSEGIVVGRRTVFIVANAEAPKRPHIITQNNM